MSLKLHPSVCLMLLSMSLLEPQVAMRKLTGRVEKCI